MKAAIVGRSLRGVAEVATASGLASGDVQLHQGDRNHLRVRPGSDAGKRSVDHWVRCNCLPLKANTRIGSNISKALYSVQSARAIAGKRTETGFRWEV